MPLFDSCRFGFCVACTLTIILIASCATSSTDSQSSQPSVLPSRVIKSAGPTVPNRYVVVLRETLESARTEQTPDGNIRITPAARNAIRTSVNAIALEYNVRVIHIYENTIQGFAAEMSAEQARKLSHDPRIDFIEEDAVVTTQANQPNSPWGLDRIDQQTGRDGSYTYAATGLGIHAYVVDTGIRTSHNEFQGRASVALDVLAGNGQDCNGHGTHVAGTIGGTTFGVAKDVQLHAVRVLGCDGSGAWSAVIQAIDWLAVNALTPAVVNMSLGGPRHEALDRAVTKASYSLIFVVAAGNSGDYLGKYSPAGNVRVIAVQASDINDNRAPFSNYGGIELYAPGVGILSAWMGSDSDTRVLQGTSMASPHVAGVVARHLEIRPFLDTDRIKELISENRTLQAINGNPTSNPKGSLIYASYRQAMLERYDCTVLSGYAFDDAYPDTPITITFRTCYQNSCPVFAEVPANIFRQDLLDRKMGNGAHAFSVPVPAVLKDGIRRALFVQVKDSNHLIRDSFGENGRPIQCQ